MLALGLLGAALGLEAASLVALAQRKLAGKPDAYRDVQQQVSSKRSEREPQCLDDTGATFDRQSTNALAWQGAFDHPGRSVVVRDRSPAADQLAGLERYGGPG